MGQAIHPTTDLWLQKLSAQKHEPRQYRPYQAQTKAHKWYFYRSFRIRIDTNLDPEVVVLRVHRIEEITIALGLTELIEKKLN